MKVKAILFDIDGTLIDLNVVVRVIQHVCIEKNYRKITKKEVYEKIIGYTLKKGVMDVLGIDKNQAEEFDKAYIEHYSKNHIANFLPHVKETLQALKDRKIKIGIVTTKGRETAISSIRELNIPHDAIITADDVKKIKPDAEPILKTCRLLNVKPNETMMVGDHIFDVQSAKNANVYSVAVATGAKTKQELLKESPDFLIDSLKELLTLID